MSGTPWDRRFFESTRGQVVTLLRRRNHTIEELARALDLTDNAIRLHVAALERDGIVRQQGVRRGVGKPSHDYGLTLEAERMFLKAHEPVLAELLGVLSESLPAETVDGLLRTAGERLARQQPAPSGDMRQRVDAAVALLGNLGGLASVEPAGEGFRIEGVSCPLFAVAAEHPEVCRLAESLLATYIGAPVTECCDRGERPRCRFLVGNHVTNGAPET